MGMGMGMGAQGVCSYQCARGVKTRCTSRYTLCRYTLCKYGVRVCGAGTRGGMRCGYAVVVCGVRCGDIGCGRYTVCVSATKGLPTPRLLSCMSLLNDCCVARDSASIHHIRESATAESNQRDDMRGVLYERQIRSARSHRIQGASQ